MIVGWGLVAGAYIILEVLWALIRRSDSEWSIVWYAFAVIAYLAISAAGFAFVFSDTGEGIGAAVVSLLIAVPAVAFRFTIGRDS
jgi:hypothetical protein